MPIFLMTSTLLISLGSFVREWADDRGWELDGLGCSGGGDGGINPSRTIVWQGCEMLANFGMWCSANQGSTIKILVPSLRPFRGRTGRLTKYQRQRQKFPLTLPPTEEQDEVTRAFGELRKTCIEGEKRARKHSDWILLGTWQLIEQRSMLWCYSRLCQASVRYHALK